MDKLILFKFAIETILEEKVVPFMATIEKVYFVSKIVREFRPKTVILSQEEWERRSWS
jgi:uncharacterized SAM-binding protein YcdF (DUF218 family)